MDDKVSKNQIQKDQIQDQADPLVHSFNTKTLKTAFTPKIMTLLLGVIIVGILSGYFLSTRVSSTTGGSALGGILN